MPDAVSPLAAGLPTGQRPPLLVLNPHARGNRLHPYAPRVLESLARNGLRPELCQESDLARARLRVHTAVQEGCPLVIAAGGDGTIEAIAPILINTPSAVGILPLGTYNNIAASLNIPSDLQTACEVLVSGVAHPIDVGQVQAQAAPHPQIFIEQATLGLGPLLAPVGEHFEKGYWLEALRALPAAARLEPVGVHVAVDGGRAAWDATTLLITICNAPRSAAAFVLAPEARMDDGLLDVCVYDGLRQADLAARIPEFITGGLSGPGVRRTRASSVEISAGDSSAGHDLLIAADAEVVGATPATFRVLPGVLRAIVPREVAEGGR